MNVGIREFKARLSYYVGRASRGEEVVVTDRGVPKVRLAAVGSPGPPSEIRHLLEQGRIVYRPFDPAKLPLPVEMKPGTKTAVDFVLDQRR